jgi:hypothetical protein
MERVKDDRGGTVMTVDRLYRHLLQKLINANIDIDAYLQLRKAKGYMSVSENDHLRDNLFELCRDASSFARNAPIQKTPGSSEAGCERKQVTVLISDASLLEWIQ